jgi:hypothetical protein
MTGRFDRAVCVGRQGGLMARSADVALIAPPGESATVSLDQVERLRAALDEARDEGVRGVRGRSRT